MDDDGNGYVDDCHGYNFVERSGNVANGDGSHGTHVAGTIAAKINNGVGVAGVAGGNWQAGLPGVSLMHGVVFGVDSSGTPSQAGFAESLVYAANNGAHISSNSWGKNTHNIFDLPVLDAIDYCKHMGMIVVFAAGNSDTEEPSYPGFYPPTIAVGATDSRKEATSFTNYGTWLDISAPGANISSTVLNGAYAKYSGTSMACPQVSAVLALGWAMKPHAMADELQSCLYQTADRLDKYQNIRKAKVKGKLGAGLVDAYEFLKCVSYPEGTCGNGKLDNDALEECDDNDFAVNDTCQTRGYFHGGNLTCRSDCTVSTYHCFKKVDTTGWLSLGQNEISQ